MSMSRLLCLPGALTYSNMLAFRMLVLSLPGVLMPPANIALPHLQWRPHLGCRLRWRL